MSVADEFTLDFARPERIGLEEAIFCAGKSPEQIDAILAAARERGASLLLTRLDPEKRDRLGAEARLDYCPVSRTAVFGQPPPVAGPARVAVVAAGTSDVPVAREVLRTLGYAGRAATLFADVGVAGLWRLTTRLEEIRAHPVVIVAAGMDAALPSVVGGLVAGAVIAVPTSVGYGVAAGGRTALDAVLASCAPGIVVVNIDNGYGAACAALRLLNAASRLAQEAER
ncbi:MULTISPECIES: nickel pincer cofactor biosynthesis protein LarB [Methylobacterium]|jgi:NCAIR mutase (PurE)-related protein|uniref:nickel pincer cofactor biosynthesis protein LarB n=2 Tax=Methylobacteriaceae TaxID=119045 RepID=UPI0011CA4AA0|nr:MULTISPECIES: nickel pincer cofactor biosynthesis protein LarB [Methylobacterium]TXN42324.1 nickel pincer cofactor biosynthesis protein LarB [Methylobacterium sp. WL7]GJE20372.1 Pyridinium-3,5-biscarboxylic acid mononucleotide synthase [Methylobacterium mesophilicum]